MRIVEDRDLVGICCDGESSIMDSFLDIYIDDGISPSPFKSIEEAKMFAKIVMRLLESVMK